MSDGPLGILALGGRLPFAVAETVVAAGRPVFLVGVTGITAPDIAAYPHGWAALIEAGRILGHFRRAGCRDLVFAGTMLRPRLSSLRFDLGTLRMLGVLLASRAGGDDAVMQKVTRAVEADGFRVLGIAEVAPRLIGPAGIIGSIPSGAALDADARVGFALLRAIGPHDVGQACVVHRGRVLAVEAAEGTTEMVKRVGVLRANGRFPVEGRAGVLVKAPKPQQELRNDMPVLGTETIDAAVQAGLAGVVWAAGGVLLVDAEDMIRRADAGGLALGGLQDGAP